MRTVVVPIDARKTVVPTVPGFRIGTFLSNGEVALYPRSPTFETEAEARAFIAGAAWALDEGSED